MSWIKPTVKHVLAVSVALFVAWVLIQWLGVDSPIVMVLIGAIAVAAEKGMREHPSIPVPEYVND